MDTPIDYAEVGLIAGLEVHQQLLTDQKMFCRCPAGRYTATHDGEVLRHMRPTLSELGEYDGTALMELCWVLGHTDERAEVMRMMRRPINHETTEREPHNGYLIMQGGLPEIEEYIATHWK